MYVEYGQWYKMGWKYNDKQAKKMFLLREKEGLEYGVIGQRFGTDGGHTRNIVNRYRRSLPSGTGIDDRPIPRQSDNIKGRVSTSTKTKREREKKWT